MVYDLQAMKCRLVDVEPKDGGKTWSDNVREAYNLVW
jgi:hypothetical protein